MSFGNKLKSLREAKQLNQEDVAKYMKVDRSTVGKWESSPSKPDYEKLVRLAEFYNVTTDYLLGNTSSTNVTRVPVLGRIAAGIPLEAITDIIDFEEIPKSLADTGDFFGLLIKGTSMEPRIRENDVVIVKKQSDVCSGDIAVILINGNDATLKKVTKNENGLVLTAFNPEVYPPQFYSNSQIISLPVEILGKVVELRGKF